jgi:hypothetical protein
MEKEFIPYEQALKLKELGFDKECLKRYYEKELVGNGGYFPNSIKAPLYQQAFRWFREEYKLHSTITSISQESWQWHITKPGESLGKLYDEDFYTYEETELECLKKLIEIVKNK